MIIDQIIIERRDGPTACGLLFYRERGEVFRLPWSFEMRNESDLFVRFYSDPYQFPVLQRHQAKFATTVTETILTKI